MRTIVARSIDSAWNDLAIHDRLMKFAREYADDRSVFQSMAVIFETPSLLDEITFETHMWDRLQSLSDKDAWLGQPYDPEVSHDPSSPHFAVSFGGEAFFVVGLHPGASRKSRQFEAPVIVFNPRDQFEQLREMGRYEKLRQSIIGRDAAFSGSENPMLARHGEASAALQYSGRLIEGEWQCPFRYAALRDAA